VALKYCNFKGGGKGMDVNAFEQELMRRSPLAACVLEISDFIFDDRLLSSIWGGHRGRCYEDVLKFDDFLRLMRDALVHHGGSAHQLFVELERDDAQPVDESNFYRKLARTPVGLSRALLRECTARLAGLMPAAEAQLPVCFDGFEVIVGDGKKVRNAAKRLKPTRGYAGKLIGAKALVAMDVRGGMAVAMSDSLDGMANDVPLVPALMEQLRQMIARPILSVWDRQFDDVRTLGRLSSRGGDAFLVRLKQRNHTYVVESSVQGVDARGRAVRDEIGLLGKGKDAMRVRRITLTRGDGEEDVVLLSNLLDREAFAAADLLGLYRRRWGIEQAFQQVTETFSLSHLIGSSPRAVLFQFAYCLLLYNLVQLIKAYVADDGKVLAATVSTFYLFQDIRKELAAWAYHTGGAWPRCHRDAGQMRRRLRELLRELLRGSWDPVGYTKASDKKPRPKPPPPKRLHGGHSSVQRLLEGRAVVIVS
jgi:Transposase DDE domain